MTNEDYIELRTRLLNDPVVLRALAHGLQAGPAPAPTAAPGPAADPLLSYKEAGELMGCSPKYVGKCVALGRLESSAGRIALSDLRQGVLRYCTVAVRTRFLDNLARWQAERAAAAAPRLRVVEPARPVAEQPDLFSLPAALVALP